MTCDEFRGHMTQYLGGRLSESLKMQMDEHLAGCIACQRYLAAARAGMDGQTPDNDSAAIIRIAYAIIQEGLQESAGEIQVKPTERGVGVFFRIRDDLQESMPLPKYVQAPLLSRFRIMAGLDPAPADAPREGRIELIWKTRDYTLDLSSEPTEHGEMIVMRPSEKSQASS